MKNLTKFILVLFLLINAPLFCYQEPLTEISSREKFQNLYPSLDTYEATLNNTVARFFLVRHGENEGNAKRLVDGRTLNLPLTEKGRMDSLAAGEFIAQKIDQIDLLVSSPMKRTRQTAAEIIKSFETTPTIVFDDRLMERYYGIFEGGSEEIYAPYEEEEALAIAGISSLAERLAYREHASMENYQETYDRMSSVIFELAKQNLGKNIVITTHGNSLWSLFLMGNAQQYNSFDQNFKFKITNGCILVIESDGYNINIKAFKGEELLRIDDSIQAEAVRGIQNF
jgi:broad specificity phosphatase PhoE